MGLVAPSVTLSKTSRSHNLSKGHDLAARAFDSAYDAGRSEVDREAAQLVAVHSQAARSDCSPNLPQDLRNSQAAALLLAGHAMALAEPYCHLEVEAGAFSDRVASAVTLPRVHETLPKSLYPPS